MSYEYKYDESGAYFYYFLSIVLATFVFPIGYYYISKSVTSESFGDWEESEDFKIHQRIRQEKNKRTWENPRISYLFITWSFAVILLIFSSHKMYTTQMEEYSVAWNPYEILGVSMFASVKDIKSAYRKLSIKWHPDKNDSPEAHDKFVDIGKAMKTLTDDAIRENWEKFGNPDGRQSFSYGIALPSALVDPKNKFFVLLFYAVLFGFILPYVVGSWWTKSQKFTKDGVQNASMTVFFDELKEGANVKKILELVCGSVEVMECVPWRGEQEMENVRALWKIVKKEVLDRSGETLEFPKKFNAAYCLKAYTILYAHLYRVPITDPNLKEDSYILIPTIRFLVLKGILNIVAAHFWLLPSLHAIEISRLLLQALPLSVATSGAPFFNSNVGPISGTGIVGSGDKDAGVDLYMLPFVDRDVVKFLRTKKQGINKYIIRNIPQLLELEMGERHQLLKDAILDSMKGGPKRRNSKNEDSTPEQEKQLEAEAEKRTRLAITIARSIPRIRIMSAEFRCVGEQIIGPGSLVTFVVRLGAVNYAGEEPNKERNPQVLEMMKGSTSSSARKSFDGSVSSPIEDKNTFEVDSDGEVEDIGRSKAEANGTLKPQPTKLTKLLSGTYWKNPNRPIYAPLYPQFDADTEKWKRPSYYVWLCNTKNNRVVGTPLQVNQLVPISVYEDPSKTDNSGSKLVSFKFQAPTQAGQYVFTVVVLSDSFIGLEVKQDVKLIVVEPDKKEEMERLKFEKDIWKDFEEDDRLEKEIRSNVLGGGFSAIKEVVHEDSDSDWISEEDD